MAYKFKIYTGSQWINVLTDTNIDITDANGYFTATELDGVLDELYLNSETVTSTSNPSSSDDGYNIGTMWINTSNDFIFVCVDNTSSNAIWEQIQTYNTVSVSGASTISSNKTYGVNTSGGTFTLTLPSAPSSGDNVKFVPESDWSTTNFTISGNGGNIQGQSDTFLVDVDYGFELTYNNTTWGWGLS